MNKMSASSATQLNKILSFLSAEQKDKIPQKVWKKIKDKTDNSIDTKIYETQNIKIENILPETRKYLSFIFLNYLATEEEKKEYINIIKINEENYQQMLHKKYDPDDIFKRLENKLSEQHMELVEVKQEKFFQRILSKLVEWIKGKR